MVYSPIRGSDFVVVIIKIKSNKLYFRRQGPYHTNTDTHKTYTHTRTHTQTHKKKDCGGRHLIAAYYSFIYPKG